MKRDATIGTATLLLGLAAMLPVTPADGQCPANVAEKLMAFDAANGDEFGVDVDLSGSVLIVGSYHDAAPLARSGSAHVYRLTGGDWVFEQKLTASDAAANDEFGWGVAIEPSVALVGARFDDEGSSGTGSAYVFRFDGSTWNEEAKLTATPPTNAINFGRVLDLHGTVAVVGSELSNVAAVNGGAAFVYRYDGVGWPQEVELNGAAPAAFDNFGADVAVHGTRIVVGAPGDDAEAIDAGTCSVYAYDGVGWSLESTLTAPDGLSNDQFGDAVAISGDRILVGAWGDDDAGGSSGSAFVFVRTASTWSLEQKLTASDAQVNDRFGWSVALDNDVAVIGARLEDDGGNDAGAAYIFQRVGGTWFEQAKLAAPDAEPNDDFGHAVAVHNTRLVVGAQKEDVPGFLSGAAYTFGGLTDCNGNGVLDLCDIAAGTSSDCDGNETPDDCEPCFLADIDDDGNVGFSDMNLVLTAWGPCPGCPEDIICNGVVGFADLNLVLAEWGPCCGDTCAVAGHGH